MSTDISTREDQEQRIFETLMGRLEKEMSLVEFTTFVKRLSRFLDIEPNPVYVNSLLISLSERAHITVLEAVREHTTYSWMVIRDVTVLALRTEAKYRGILEAHNTEHQE